MLTQDKKLNWGSLNLKTDFTCIDTIDSLESSNSSFKNNLDHVFVN